MIGTKCTSSLEWYWWCCSLQNGRSFRFWYQLCVGVVWGGRQSFPTPMWKWIKETFFKIDSRSPKGRALSHTATHHTSHLEDSNRKDILLHFWTGGHLFYSSRRKMFFSLARNRPNQWQPARTQALERRSTSTPFLLRACSSSSLFSVQEHASPWFSGLAYGLCHSLLISNCKSLLFSKFILLVNNWLSHFVKDDTNKKQFSGHYLGVLQFNSIRSLSPWR